LGLRCRKVMAATSPVPRIRAAMVRVNSMG
jgi:hypothetical protein